MIQLQDTLIKQERDLRYYLNMVDSQNIQEVGGWRATPDQLASKDGDVGMSTEDTPADDVRLWAGSTNKNTAPWRVTEAGKMFATGVTIRVDLNSGKYIQIDANGMRIYNGSINTFEADANGEVTAKAITLRNDLTGGAYIQIDTNGIVINNGSFNTFVADDDGKVTATAITLQTAAGYPKVLMDPNGNLLGAYYDANNYIKLEPDDTGIPAYQVFAGGSLRFYMNYEAITSTFALISTQKLLITAALDIEFDVSPSYLYINNWGTLRNKDTSETLQQALDTKQNTITGASGSFTTVDGKTVTVSNGIITSIV